MTVAWRGRGPGGIYGVCPVQMVRGGGRAPAARIGLATRWAALGGSDQGSTVESAGAAREDWSGVVAGEGQVRATDPPRPGVGTRGRQGGRTPRAGLVRGASGGLVRGGSRGPAGWATL